MPTGDLRYQGIDDVLHWVDATRASGAVEVGRGDGALTIYFHGGRLTFADRGNQPPTHGEIAAAGIERDMWQRAASRPEARSSVSAALLAEGVPREAVERFALRRITLAVDALRKLWAGKFVTTRAVHPFGTAAGIEVSRVYCPPVVGDGSERFDALMALAPTDRFQVTLNGRDWSALTALVAPFRYRDLVDRLGRESADHLFAALERAELAQIVQADLSALPSEPEPAPAQHDAAGEPASEQSEAGEVDRPVDPQVDSFEGESSEWQVEYEDASHADEEDASDGDASESFEESESDIDADESDGDEPTGEDVMAEEENRLEHSPGEDVTLFGDDDDETGVAELPDDTWVADTQPTSTQPDFEFEGHAPESDPDDDSESDEPALFLEEIAAHEGEEQPHSDVQTLPGPAAAEGPPASLSAAMNGFPVELLGEPEHGAVFGSPEGEGYEGADSLFLVAPTVGSGAGASESSALDGTAHDGDSESRHVAHVLVFEEGEAPFPPELLSEGERASEHPDPLGFESLDMVDDLLDQILPGLTGDLDDHPAPQVIGRQDESDLSDGAEDTRTGGARDEEATESWDGEPVTEQADGSRNGEPVSEQADGSWLGEPADEDGDDAEPLSGLVPDTSTVDGSERRGGDAEEAPEPDEREEAPEPEDPAERARSRWRGRASNPSAEGTYQLVADLRKQMDVPPEAQPSTLRRVIAAVTRL